ncbi:MAG TPA: ABC transporter ATP-binding protein [Candidatus Saccharimonadales bacterium]|nr:ABC transporter ATP-binding protein [Candidatus Saccharimonadales bacterium]
MKLLLRAFSFFRADVPRIIVVVVLLLGSIGASLLKPWPLALIVDSVLGTKPLPAFLRDTSFAQSKEKLLLVLTIITLLLYFGQGALSSWQNFLSIKLGLRGLRRVRNELFASLQRLSLRFYQKSLAGDLIYRASWDTYAFQTLFQQGFVTFLTAFISLVLMLAIMWKLNGPLALAAIAVLPLLLFSIKVFGKEMRERGVAAQRADSRVISLVQQNISAHQLIQSYTREEQEQVAFVQQTKLAESTRLSQHGWELLYWVGVSVVFGIGTAVIVWLGSRQVLQGNLTIGQLLVFVAYLAQLYEPLNQLSHVGSTISTAGAGAQRVFEVLDAQEEVRERPVARAIVSKSATGSPGNSLVLKGEVRFDHVVFGYETGKDVLRDLSFEVRTGEALAIIGPSGAGKTTMLNLLPRFFDVTAGAVLLDGVDVRDLKLKDLRTHISLVLQEPILLPGTVAENIAFGRPGASLDEIKNAAHAANAHRFIDALPSKYDTILGEGGGMLSVGERQRLNLARAFLKDAPILLLDEPTSALDLESEEQVVSSLALLMANRTTLIVAHRYSTIQKVNKVLVLEHGQISEFGTPEELKNAQGYFSRRSG